MHLTFVWGDVPVAIIRSDIGTIVFAAMVLGCSSLTAGAQAQTKTENSSLAQQGQPPGPRVGQPVQRRVPPLPRPDARENTEKSRINAWTIGLAAGRTEGAPLEFAAELARVLDDGDKMRILPIVTRGPFDNVYDLLYLRGVDAAIIYGDVLDHFKNKPEFAAAASRIDYLLNLFPSEVHVFARPEIHSLQDLAGKVVNFNTEGTAAAFSGPIVFRRLGIEVKQTFIPHGVAMEKMRRGDEVAATFWVSSKPLAPFLKGTWPEGFKFLPIEYSDKLRYYAPAYLEASDYPNLIKEGERIATISVPAVLAVYAWHKDDERYRRIARMIDYLFERFERLQKEPGYHEKWKDLNLAATVPGWRRFPPLQGRLDKIAGTTPDRIRFPKGHAHNGSGVQKVRLRHREAAKCCKRRTVSAAIRRGRAALHLRSRRTKARAPQYPIVDAALGYVGNSYSDDE
jgi:TRAP-type uncharacterized transport system substrate-binding protein